MSQADDEVNFSESENEAPPVESPVPEAPAPQDEELEDAPAENPVPVAENPVGPVPAAHSRRQRRRSRQRARKNSNPQRVQLQPRDLRHTLGTQRAAVTTTALPVPVPAHLPTPPFGCPTTLNPCARRVLGPNPDAIVQTLHHLLSFGYALGGTATPPPGPTGKNTEPCMILSCIFVC